jgi:NAD(P)-dependent dehydrogenase (short-subunit alcohol dehydrogenase family)
MRDLAGKTAFVTGGASGIGFALGRPFAEDGTKVMLADIETDALATAVKALRDSGTATSVPIQTLPARCLNLSLSIR